MGDDVPPERTVHGRQAVQARRSELAEAWAGFIATARPWDYAATLTFDPKRREPVPPGPQRTGTKHRLQWPTRLTEDPRVRLRVLTRDVADALVRAWLRANERATGEPIAAVVAMEYHKNGAPHFHGLLGRNGGFSPAERAFLEETWNDLAGFCRIEEPRSVEDCAAYASKYLVKDLARGCILLHPPHGNLREPSRPPRFGAG